MHGDTRVEVTGSVQHAAHHDRLNEIFFVLRVPQMQLTPPLLCLTIKAALATDLSYVWGIRMLSNCRAYLAPEIPAVECICRGPVTHASV